MFFFFQNWRSALPLITIIFESLLWKSTFYLIFSDFFFIFIIMRVYTHWWIISNHSNIVKEKNQWKKMFSPKRNFSFVSSVLCTLNDNFVAQKSFSRENFSWKLLFLKHKFKLLLSFLCTLLMIYTKAFKNLIILKVILCKKSKTGPKYDFFLSSILCTRSDISIIQKNFSWKWFSWTIFSLKITFLKLSWVTPLIIFTKRFKKRFSRK